MTSPQTRGRLRSRWWPAVLLLSTALMTGCSSGGDPDTRPDQTTGSTSEQMSVADDGTVPDDLTVRDVSDDVLSYAAPEPLAKVTGEVVLLDDSSVPATLEVIEVTSSPTSTVLSARLSTEQGTNSVGRSFSRDQAFTMVTGVALTVQQQSYYPAEYEYGPAALAQHCACTEVIRGLGPEGVYVYAAYEALPPETSAVTVEVPGFEPVEVDVTQAAD